MCAHISHDLVNLFVTFLSFWCWMWALAWWSAQVHEVGTQAPPHAQVFPKLSGIVGAVLEGERGSLKALLSPCFVKELPWLLCRICAGIYTCGHCVVCSGFPSAQEKPSSQGSIWGWYTVSGSDSCSCCVAHLVLSRCKIKHMLLMLSWPRLMLLFQGFMSEAQKTWKSLMEKTY